MHSRMPTCHVLEIVGDSCALFLSRLDSVEPDLLSLFGTMPSEGENVGKKLERLLMDKERELQGVSSRQSSSSAQLTRLQTQHEQLE